MSESVAPKKQSGRKGKWHIVSLRSRYMAVISSPEMRAVEREIAREFAAQAKLRTVAAIRKERARSTRCCSTPTRKLRPMLLGLLSTRSAGRWAWRAHRRRVCSLTVKQYAPQHKGGV